MYDELVDWYWTISPAILPTHNPALFVKDDRSSDFAELLSDHNEYHVQLSGFREDGVTRFYDGEEVSIVKARMSAQCLYWLNYFVWKLYVADDMDMLERFKVAYPEINVNIFDISKKVLCFAANSVSTTTRVNI